MRRSQLLVLLISPALAGLVAGCASSAPPKPAAAPVIQAATPEQAVAVQTDMLKIDPNARVGHVAAINSAAGMASIAGIPTNEVHVGDTLVFTDAKQVPIGNGTVQSIDTTTDASYPFLIVDYKPNPNGRDLIRNDLAIFIPPAH